MEGFNVQNAWSRWYQQPSPQGPQGNVCAGTIQLGRKQRGSPTPAGREACSRGQAQEGQVWLPCPVRAQCRHLGTAAEAAPTSRGLERVVAPELSPGPW